MKILFLISQLPYPPDTGAKIRSYNLIKRLSGRHNITMLTFGEKRAERNKLDHLKAICTDVVLIERKDRNKYLHLLMNLFSVAPYVVKKYYSEDLRDKVRALAGESDFDIIHCDSLQMSLNLKGVGGLPKVLTEHNVETRIWQRYAETERNPLKKAYINIQSRKMRDYEVKTCGSFDRCVAVSEVDKDILTENGSAKDVAVVTNGVDCEYFKPQDTEVKQHRLVFTGSLDWIPNEDGMLYFLKEIYPFVKKEIPDVGITIVGRSPGGRLKELAAKDSSVNLTGRVEDVRPHVAEGEVFIAPLRIGGGTRLKILEAMAMGKAVVSTSVGAEGIDAENGKEIMIADKPEEFAQSVIRLFTDDTLKNNLGRAGLDKAKSKYDWNIIAEELDKVWQEAKILKKGSA